MLSFIYTKPQAKDKNFDLREVHSWILYPFFFIPPPFPPPPLPPPPQKKIEVSSGIITLYEHGWY